MKNHINEIIRAYTMGEKTQEETNQALQDAHAGIRLDPDRSRLTEAELRRTVVGCYPEQANGFGMLDTGTGTMDKVAVKDGKLLNCDCGEMHAILHIAGRRYTVRGVTLAEG